MKHTKGPWAADIIGRQIAILSRNERVICKLQKHHGEEPLVPMAEFDGSEEDKANARLISAAPELYESLQELVKAFQSATGQPGWAAGPIVAKAIAALAKAEVG